MNVATVILAAGQGTRMRSKLPKILHPLRGQPMIDYTVNLAMQLSSQPPVLVVGHGAKLVHNQVGECVRYVLQETRLGTGHALLQAQELLQGRSEAVFVLYGDMPLLTPPTCSRVIESFSQATPTPAIAMLTLTIPEGASSMGFGRVERDAQGRVTGVVEEFQATPEQLRLRELNCGIYCFRADWLWERLPKLPISSKGEYLLTDMVEVAAREGEPIIAVPVDDPDDVLGINDRILLSQAEKILQRRINIELMRGGVTLIDPDTTYVDVGVQVAPDTIIYPNTHLLGDTSIEDDCMIGPNVVLRNTTVGPRCRIVASVLEEASLGADVTVGPFGHLRTDARLDNGVHMGNFGEVKNSYLGPGTKMGHFSYVGDATLGARVNIGAGTVTCNFDGQRKHATIIGDDVFVGSGTMLRAPVVVGAGAKIGAGSVVTHDVPANGLVYGSPARLHGMARPDEVEAQPDDAVSMEERAAGEQGK